MLLTWPAEAVVVLSDMDLLKAVETTRSPFTLGEWVTDYGGRQWRGQATVGRIGSSVPGHGAGHAIETFLSALATPGKWTEVPVGRPPIPPLGDVPLMLGSPTVADDFLRGTLATPLIADGKIVSGQLLRIGLRTYRVFSAAAGASAGAPGTLILEPGIMPVSGQPVRPVSTVRARLAPGASVSAPRDADWMGPWVVSWNEYLRA